MLAVADVFEPPPPVDYQAWAEKNVVFPSTERFRGPYRRENLPFFEAIFEALSPEHPCRIVTLSKSAQVGGTIAANVFIGCTMEMDPCFLLYAAPTEELGRRWSKMKLKPLLRSSAALRALFPERSRDAVDSLMYKETDDGRGVIQVSGANSAAALSQMTMHRQVQDDLAKWGKLDQGGDPEGLADSRSRAVEFAKIFKISTPLIMPGCRITKNFREGSQERCFLPCPHCQHMQVLEWDNMLANLDPDHPEDAHFTCVGCGVEIREHHRPWMLERHEWRADNPNASRYHRSFHIWSAYSPLQSFELIAREWLRAKGDPAAEQVFLNDTVGLAYEAQGEAPPWEELRDRGRASHYDHGTVPLGALVLTLGIDCQQDRVEWQLVGWGRERRRWVIEVGVIPGHIAEPKTQSILDGVLAQAWPTAVPGRRRVVDMAAIDGNAWTEEVWAFVKGRPVSRLIMVRGRGEETAPLFAKVKRERNPKTGKTVKYSGRFFNFAASILKMALYRNAKKADPAEFGYIHFPRGMEDDYFQQLCAERRVAKTNRQGFTVYGWEKDPAQANEALDTMNQAECAAIRFGVRAFQDSNWDKLEYEREMPAAEAQFDLEEPRFALLMPETSGNGGYSADQTPMPGVADKWKRRR